MAETFNISTWDKIMDGSPTLKALVEWRVNYEVQQKQTEIDDLSQQLVEKDTRIQQLETDNINTMLALTEVYEELLTLQGGTI